jgi:hypothetical protein
MTVRYHVDKKDLYFVSVTWQSLLEHFDVAE